MPRFAVTKYKPEQDSSKSQKAQKLAKSDGVLVLEVKSRKVEVGQGDKKQKVDQLSCPCGCGEFTADRKTTFRMGHDARLRGALQRAHLTGAKVVRILDGKAEGAKTAKEYASQFGGSFTKAIEAADSRRQKANREVLQKAMKSTRLIKVGRHETTGQVVAVREASNDSPNRFDIEYVTQQGQKKTLKNVAEDEAPKATQADIKRLQPKEDSKEEAGEPAAA